MKRSKANCLFWKQVFSFIFSYAIKRRKANASRYHSTSGISWAMLQNYSKVASRNLVKHKLFTIINVTGLAMGMSIFLLAMAMIYGVSNFDEFHLKGDRIYRVITNWQSSTGRADMATSAPSFADKMDEFGFLVENTTSVNLAFGSTVLINRNEIPIEAYYVDGDF